MYALGRSGVVVGAQGWIQGPARRTQPLLQGTIQDVRQADLGAYLPRSGSAPALLELLTTPVDVFPPCTVGRRGASMGMAGVAAIAAAGAALTRRAGEAASPPLRSAAGLSWADPCRKQLSGVQLGSHECEALQVKTAARHWQPAAASRCSSSKALTGCSRRSSKASATAGAAGRRWKVR